MTKLHGFRKSLRKKLKNPSFVLGVKLTIGTHMTMDKFREQVNEGNINNGDGPAFLATIDKESDIAIYASDVESCNKFPEWVTHVVYYSK